MQTAKYIILFLTIATLHNTSLIASQSHKQTIKTIDSTIVALNIGTSVFDSTFLFKIQETLRLAEQINYTPGIAQLYRGLTIYYKVNGYSNEATKNLNHAIMFAEKSNNKKIMGDVYKTTGTLKFNEYKPDEAMEWFIKASKMYLDAKDSAMYIESLSNIGSVHYVSKNYEKAAWYFNECIKQANSKAFTIQKRGALLNLAAIYVKQNSYQTALETYRKILNQKGTIFTKNYLTVYNGIGHCYMELEKYDLALENFTKALHYADSLSNLYSTSSIQFKIGSVYFAKNEFKQAESELIESYNTAIKAKNYQVISNSAKKLSEIYKLQNQHKLAFEYFELYKQFKDSITNIDKNVNFVNISDEWEHEMEIEKIRFLHKKKLFKVFTVAGFILFAFVLVLMLYLKQKQKIKSLEKNRIKLNENIKDKAQDLIDKGSKLESKKALLDKLEEQLKKLSLNVDNENLSEIKALISSIKSSKSETLWKEFESRFKILSEDFTEKIIKLAPDLTPQELNICSYLRLNLTNKEIRELTFQNQEGLNMARFRIRKKLNLNNTDTNLAEYLQNI